MDSKKKPILVVVAVIVKWSSEGLLIHTQLRNVLNKEYDPLYDQTHETMGETVDPGEDVLDALIRGCREELGSPGLVPEMVIGSDNEVFFTRPWEDEMRGLSPWYFIQQLVGPQPWVGPVFVVAVAEDFEPQLDKEGEVSGHKWWEASNLHEKLINNPSGFMGFHYPALMKACREENEIMKALGH